MAVDKAQVIKLAQEAGIPAAEFAGWEGHELGLYEDTRAASASLTVALRIAQQKAALRPWVLDLGHRALALSRAQGEALRAKLDQAGIPYSSEDLAIVYLSRIRRVTRDHQEILKELAKR